MVIYGNFAYAWTRSIVWWREQLSYHNMDSSSFWDEVDNWISILKFANWGFSAMDFIYRIIRKMVLIYRLNNPTNWPLNRSSQSLSIKYFDPSLVSIQFILPPTYQNKKRIQWNFKKLIEWISTKIYKLNACQNQLKLWHSNI
jgi:hypothetical protein